VIIGAHAIIFAHDPEAARAFFRDVFGFPSVDAGREWLIFELPPTEFAIHPSEADGQHELYLMCDDIEATVEELKQKGVEFTRPVSDQGWGLVTALAVPGAADLALYEPKHPSPVAARETPDR
jgi:catechol 2,3-dioxygenase-like lactoylglutathione lyase family enzyme